MAFEKFTVTKRNGKKEKIQREKIEKAAIFNLQKTGLSAEKLMEQMAFNIKDGMRTEYIADEMTGICINNITPTEPEWRLAAGRSQMVSNIKKKNIAAEKILNRNDDIEFCLSKAKYSTFLQLMFSSNLYDTKWFADFDKDYLDKLFELTVDMDRNFDYFIESVVTLESKFLMNFETPQHLYFTVSFIYAQQYCIDHKEYEIIDGKKVLNRTVITEKTKEYYEDSSNRKVSFPSVILSELRKPNPNLASCFIGLMPDELDEIFNLIHDFAMISKKGGGIGACLDKVRAHLSFLQGVKGRSTGVKYLMKVLNSVMIYVNQSGIKEGALTPSLSLWHNDITIFLQAAQLSGGEEREKSMDLYLQCIVNDNFMERCEKDLPWYTFDPYEIKTKYDIDLSDTWGEKYEEDYEFLIKEAEAGNLEIFHRYERAKDLFKEIMVTLIQRGTPYLTFKENINRVSNMKNAGTIYAANLCVESFSIFDEYTTHTCNLLSLVAPFIHDDEIKRVTKTAVELLDLTVSLSTPPTEKSKKHNNDIRALGLGIMGANDWMAARQCMYESEKGQDEFAKFVETVSYYSIEKSHELGVKLGSFGRYKESEWSKGHMIGKELSEILAESRTDLDWEALSEKVKIAMRNGYLMAVAPNTSSSSAIGVSSSIMPTYAALFIEETKSGNIPRMPLYIKEFPLAYKEYRHIDLFKMNTFIGKVQFWIDGGISYEPVWDFNKEENLYVKRFFDVINDARKKGVKAIYYTRWIKPQLKEDEQKEKSSNEKKSIFDDTETNDDILKVNNQNVCLGCTG